MISAKVIADSVSETTGVRLTSVQVKFHRFILPELNTHRMFSRSFSSSRAIPVSKMIEQVRKDPALPLYWGKNKSGMQAVEELSEEDMNTAKIEWFDAANHAADIVEELNTLGLHKQTANRLLEPFLWVNGIITATEWDNFFKLRLHHAAQPEIQALAKAIQSAMAKSEPKPLKLGEWHLPYIRSDEIVRDLELLKQISAARCARVSYNKHDGTQTTLEDDLELFNQLATRPHTDKHGTVYGEDEPCHLSPLEHQGTPLERHFSVVVGTSHMDNNSIVWSGNFRLWGQYRKIMEQQK